MTFSRCHLQFTHHTIFEDFSFNLIPGKWTCILGKSGIGKSSLLKILAGLIKPNEIKDFTPLEVSYLPQQDCLMPWLSVWENVFLGATLRKQQMNTEEIKQKNQFHNEEKAHYLLTQVGLSHALHLKPTALSGGMRQRVALVRTLLEEKPIILMDEPFAALDVATRLELHDLLNPLLQDKTVLLVTHDPLDAVRLADHIQFLKGSPAELTTSIEINEPKPRDLQNPVITDIYMQLLKGLTSS
jgi:putative hydroxymethylpyrimidine transport system ATP-binding protein